MSEEKKGDGLLIGILVVLVLLVLVGGGFFSIRFFRMAQVVDTERLEAEAARQEAFAAQERAAVAYAAAEAELAAQKAVQIPKDDSAVGTPEPNPKPGTDEAKEEKL